MSQEECYVFEVNPKSTKNEIRDAIQKFFDVKVKDIRILGDVITENTSILGEIKIGREDINTPIITYDNTTPSSLVIQTKEDTNGSNYSNRITIKEDGDVSMNHNVFIGENLNIDGDLSVNKITQDVSFINNVNISEKLLIDKDGDVTVTNNNMIIGTEIYLSKIIADSVFNPATLGTTHPFNVSMGNNIYNVTCSSAILTSNHSLIEAFRDNDFSWKSGLNKYSQTTTTTPKQYIYTGTETTEYYENDNSTSSTSTDGEFLEVQISNEFIVQGYTLKLDFFQKPTQGILVGYVNNRWQKIHSYNKS